MKEIERKYIVDKELWDTIDKGTSSLIVQGFLYKSENTTIRIRISDNKGYLTIKGKSVGITRSEFEYEIPIEDAEQILEEFTKKHIRKIRYEIPYGNHTWEVDVFGGNLSGLILAEIELESEDESFLKPDWVTTDVSTDPNYYNAVLIDKC